MIINPGTIPEEKGGVTSFNGREGAVVPQVGDYTAEDTGAANKSHSHSEYAPKASPVFTGSISMGRKAGSTIGNMSVAEGENTTASGYDSHAEGYCTTASGNFSHAEGGSTKASGGQSHAEGTSTTASGIDSHAEGSNTTASGPSSHAEGGNTTASGPFSHAGGNLSKANENCSFAYGFNVIANNYQFVIGTYNTEKASTGIYDDRFIVGGGWGGRLNAFRVHSSGACYGAGAYNTSGADYAELFEWADGNRSGEDRAGRFVTLDGEKIRLAGPGDDFILGIVSGNPSVVGDVYDDQWAGMYLYDIFGRPLWEDVEVPALEQPDPEDPEKTVVVIPAHMEHRQKLNPAYDSAQPYRPRTQRPEWDAVGMLGKLVAVDDGTCQVDGWCTVGEGGVATHSAERTRYRVMARLDGSHVRVLIL